LASYGLYQEASVFYTKVMAQGNSVQQAQAGQELIALYDHSAQQLSRLNRFDQADLYRHAVSALAKTLRTKVAEEIQQNQGALA
jgi:hypothetical protein